jgi:hypothetical protein
MARIRILELPAQKVGEFEQVPFVYVIDKVTREEHLQFAVEATEVDRLVDSSNAAGYLLTRNTLDFEYDEVSVDLPCEIRRGDALAADVMEYADALKQSAENVKYGQGYRDGCRGAARDLEALVGNYRRSRGLAE